VVARVLAAGVHLHPIDREALGEVRHGVFADADHGASVLGHVRRSEADPPVAGAHRRREDKVRSRTHQYRYAIGHTPVRERNVVRERPRQRCRGVEGEPEIDDRAHTRSQPFWRWGAAGRDQLRVTLDLRPSVRGDRSRVRTVGVAHFEAIETERPGAHVRDVQLVHEDHAFGGGDRHGRGGDTEQHGSTLPRHGRRVLACGNATDRDDGERPYISEMPHVTSASMHA